MKRGGPWQSWPGPPPLGEALLSAGRPQSSFGVPKTTGGWSCCQGAKRYCMLPGGCGGLRARFSFSWTCSQEDKVFF